MEDNKKTITDDMGNKIIQDAIDSLVDEGDEFKPETGKFNPYSLDSNKPLHFENNFHNGIMKLPSASKKLPSASKELPSASRKLKPAYVSMFEYEIMKNKGDVIETSEVIDTHYRKIVIPGTTGDYYIRTSFLRNLMSQFLYEGRVRPCEGGDCFYLKFTVDRKSLVENCIRRKP